MKKKLLAFLCVLSLLGSTLLSLPVPAEAVDDRLYQTEEIVGMRIGYPEATNSGKKTYIDPANKKVVPLILNGRTMVPLRFTATVTPGTKVKYTSDKDYIVVSLSDTSVKFKIGSKQLLVENSKRKKIKEISLDVAPQKINGRVMVPVRAISEGLGLHVKYIKLYDGEFVIVSRGKLDEPHLREQQRLIQSLTKGSFQNTKKNYTLTVPVNWCPGSESGSEATFMRPGERSGGWIDMSHTLTARVISVSDAKKHISRSKSDFGVLGKVTRYLKTTINGKQALITSSVRTMDYGNGFVSVTSFHQCVVVSGKTGLSIEYSYNNTSDLRTAEFDQFWKSVKLS